LSILSLCRNHGGSNRPNIRVSKPSLRRAQLSILPCKVSSSLDLREYIEIASTLTSEFQKEKKINAKHTVEEAMTAALVKECNKCGRSFLKEDGCNKIICPCGNLQCYICSENVSTYEHFGNGKCPQYDDTARRQRRDVAKAQGRAVKDVLKKTTDLTVEDVAVDKELLGVVKTKEKDVVDVQVEEIDENEVERQEIMERLRQQEEETWQRLILQAQPQVEQRLEPRPEERPGPRTTPEQRQRLRQRQRSLQQIRPPQVIPPGNWQWVPNEQAMIAAVHERERYEEEAALTAVRNFELWEQQMRQQREADEARAAADERRARARAAAEEQRVTRDTQVWDAFVRKNQTLYHPFEEEREILRTGTPEEIEMYWGMRTQNLIVFISEAKELVAEYDKKIKTQKWTELEWHRYERAKSLLNRSKTELAQFREDAVIRKKHGLARSKSSPVEIKKVNIPFFRKKSKEKITVVH